MWMWVLGYIITDGWWKPFSIPKLISYAGDHMDCLNAGGGVSISPGFQGLRCMHSGIVDAALISAM